MNTFGRARPVQVPLQHSNHNVVVIGGGPAGLMAAETLAAGGAHVTIYERMPRVARKLLLAGRGGLNLTHSEPLEKFLARYRDAAPRLRAAIEAFPPDMLRAWAEALGQETFVGTSGRVFPRAMKTSPLLRAWMQRLADLGVTFKLGHRWIGWDSDDKLMFETAEGPVAVESACMVLALGGASWTRLGSDASWVAPLQDTGIAVAPLEPSNSGVRVPWSEVFHARFTGAPLKRIALTVGGETSRGEAMITVDGLEGGAIYALSAPIRNELHANGAAMLTVDLRPDENAEALLQRLLGKGRGKQSFATYLRKALSLDPPAVGLLQEAAHAADIRLTASSPYAIAALVKAIPVRVTALAPIDRAISTAGGISFDAIDASFMLRARPGTFVAGEMLDWDAPTGGYLLQASFATGRAAALGALAYLAQHPSN
jgi:uncharacterized flavoprotein (TIGR03862 family)